VYNTFLSNMVRSGLSTYVVPFPVTSRLAAEFFEEKAFRADLVHIDAAHEEQDASDDIERWWPIVRPCGILMGDDYSEYWPGVVRAVDAFSSRVGVPLEVLGPKWVLRKPCE
jgi:predicted O-methyltransferase YrrM